MPVCALFIFCFVRLLFLNNLFLFCFVLFPASSVQQEEEEEAQSAAKCPLCGGPAGHTELISSVAEESCETAAAGQTTLRQWMETCMPRTTIWRLHKKWKAMQGGRLPLPKRRTCHLCGRHMVKATGHSIFRRTRETFCARADPKRRTVEQWLTEKRGGITTADLHRGYDKRMERRRQKK